MFAPAIKEVRMPHVKIEQKPRETGYRRWIGFAKVMLYAPLPIYAALSALWLAGVVPRWFDHDYILASAMSSYAVSVAAATMAGRRYTAMCKEWGHRHLRRMGWVE
jgi:hypothetical protein